MILGDGSPAISAKAKLDLIASETATVSTAMSGSANHTPLFVTKKLKSSSNADKR